MRRKLLWLAVVLSIILLSGLAYAQAGSFKPGSEPDGFRGIKWGQDISTVDGLVYVATDASYGGIPLYIKEGDELKIGNVQLEGIFYGFWNDKLSNVRIAINGDTNWNNFKAIVFEKFGEGYQNNKFIEEYHWWGENTWMVLRYNEFSNNGLFLMASTQISALQEEWKKEQIKKGVEEGW